MTHVRTLSLSSNTNRKCITNSCENNVKKEFFRFSSLTIQTKQNKNKTKDLSNKRYFLSPGFEQNKNN